MFLKKIRSFIKELRSSNEHAKIQNDELRWGHIYNDTIRDKEWLKNLSVSPSKWAGNYSFLYILVRILSEYKPKSIIELGLGESSKIVSSFLTNELQSSTCLIIEHDLGWKEAFRLRFELGANSKVLHLPIKSKIIKGFQVNCYHNIEEKVDGIYDLYIIDGPFGSLRYSRYDICLLAERLSRNDEFIIVIDDYNRIGEKETADHLISLLTAKGIKTHTGTCEGAKSQIIIATEKHRFAALI